MLHVFMKLPNLLQKHSENTHPQGLIDSLGDGYLMQQNRIFRKIRAKTLDLGFTYSNKMDSDYISFPMGQLEEILKRKSIPYLNNVDSLKKLNQNTQAGLNWDHVIDNLKPNYVFHESCHAVARSMSPKNSDFEKCLLTILIEESFANTCEFFAIAEAQDQIHRNFLEVNSYFTVFEDRTHLKRMIEQFNGASVFKFMLLCYLHSNFLNEHLSEKDFKKILALASFEVAPEAKALKALAENVFALNPRFRYVTTEMYLRLNGVSEPVEKVLNFDFTEIIATNKTIHNFIVYLSNIGAPDEH